MPSNFKWSLQAAEAFEKLKQVLVTAPVLALPSFKEPFTLETNVGGAKIGANLA